LFLHLSRKEQKKRFLGRIDQPEKNWKFSASDAKERERWDDYMEAYEDTRPRGKLTASGGQGNGRDDRGRGRDAGGMSDFSDSQYLAMDTLFKRIRAGRARSSAVFVAKTRRSRRSLQWQKTQTQ
jgi:hypothetical protein